MVGPSSERTDKTAYATHSLDRGCVAYVGGNPTLPGPGSCEAVHHVMRMTLRPPFAAGMWAAHVVPTPVLPKTVQAVRGSERVILPRSFHDSP